MAPCLALLSMVIGFVHMRHFLIETETKDSKEFGTDYADTESEDCFESGKISEKDKYKLCSGQNVIGRSTDNSKKTGHFGNTENPQEPKKYMNSKDTDTSGNTDSNGDIDISGDIYDKDTDTPGDTNDIGDAEITRDSKNTGIVEKTTKSHGNIKIKTDTGNSGSAENDDDSEDTEEEPEKSGYEK